MVSIVYRKGVVTCPKRADLSSAESGSKCERLFKAHAWVIHILLLEQGDEIVDLK